MQNLLINSWDGIFVVCVAIGLVVAIRRKTYFSLTWPLLIFSMMLFFGGILLMGMIGGQMIALQLYGLMGWHIPDPPTERFILTVYMLIALFAGGFTWALIDSFVQIQRQNQIYNRIHRK